MATIKTLRRIEETFTSNKEVEESDLKRQVSELIENRYNLDPPTAVAFFRALGSVVFSQSKNVSELNDVFLGPGKTLDDFKDSPLPILRASAQCAQIFFSKGKQVSCEHCHWGIDYFLRFLQNANYNDPESPDCTQLLYVSFVGCEAIVRSRTPVNKSAIPSLLGAVKAYMGFGLAGGGRPVPLLLHSPAPLPPTPRQSASPAAASPALSNMKKFRKAKPNKSKRKKESQAGRSSSAEEESSGSDCLGTSGAESGSERSGTEEEGPSACWSAQKVWSVEEKRLFCGNVRRVCLDLLAAVAQVLSKQVDVQAYWLDFFPDPSPSYHSSPGPGLPALLLKEPLYRVRIAMLKAISSFVAASRPLLDSANNRAGPSFTSFAHVLASSLLDLHKSVHFAAAAETRANVLLQLLKVLSNLVVATPFKRLQSAQQLEPQIAARALNAACHRDVNVRVAALNLLTVLVSLPGFSLSSLPPHRRIPDAQALWSFCWQINGDSYSPHPVRLESIQLTAAIARVFSGQDVHFVEESLHCVVELCSAENFDVRLHSLRLLRAFLEVLFAKPRSSHQALWDATVGSQQLSPLLTDSQGGPKGQMLVNEFLLLFTSVPSDALAGIDNSRLSLVIESTEGLLRDRSEPRLKIPPFLALCHLLPFVEEPDKGIELLGEEFSSAAGYAEERMSVELGFLLHRCSPNLSTKHLMRVLDICCAKMGRGENKFSIATFLAKLMRHISVKSTEAWLSVWERVSQALISCCESDNPKVYGQAFVCSECLLQADGILLVSPSTRAAFCEALASAWEKSIEKNWSKVVDDGLKLFCAMPTSVDVSSKVVRQLLYLSLLVTRSETENTTGMPCFVHWLLKSDGEVLESLRGEISWFLDEFPVARPFSSGEQEDLLAALPHLHAIASSESPGSDLASTLLAMLQSILDVGF